ncbi:MAG: hypothetical protein KF758_15080 [Anaerolineales bacterium]|nr:hypothetical protein [Anaerolineales bacterium]
MIEKKEFIELTKKHFNFLSSEYGFSYNESRNMFFNSEMCIFIKYDDLLSPSIQIWLKSEPEFTCLDLRWLLHEKIDRMKIDKNLMADNFAYYSNLFRAHAHQLIYEFRSLIVPTLKIIFKNMEKNITLEKMSFSQKRLYEYIKDKDPMWKPF